MAQFRAVAPAELQLLPATAACYSRQSLRNVLEGRAVGGLGFPALQEGQSSQQTVRFERWLQPLARSLLIVPAPMLCASNQCSPVLLRMSIHSQQCKEALHLLLPVRRSGTQHAQPTQQGTHQHLRTCSISCVNCAATGWKAALSLSVPGSVLSFSGGGMSRCSPFIFSPNTRPATTPFQGTSQVMSCGMKQGAQDAGFSNFQIC